MLDCAAPQLLLIYTTSVSTDAWGSRAGRTVLTVFVAQVRLCNYIYLRSHFCRT